jgi:hypothetical protein
VPDSLKEFQDAISGAPSAAEKNKEKLIRQRRSIDAAPNLGHGWELDAMSRLATGQITKARTAAAFQFWSELWLSRMAGNKVSIL